MVDIEVFRQRMKELLLQLPDAKVASGGKEITLRCRYCGDSRNKSSRHMYVMLPNGRDPMFYNCYRVNCTAKGIVTWDKLDSWGVQLNEGDIHAIIQYNKEIANLNPSYSIKRKVYNLSNALYNKNNEQLYTNKLNYLNNRLGTNFSHLDVKRMKISLNIIELMKENHIRPLIETWKLKYIAEKYITFITQDNMFAVSRNIDFKDGVKEPMNYRYFKYRLFDSYDNDIPSLYIIPTNINIYYPVKIYLTEGTFDILSVKYNIVQSEDNCIYCATLNGCYDKAIEYFISTMQFINIEFHLYVDNDMNEYQIRKLIKIIEPYQYTTYVHNNTFVGEKDFGVPKERIIDNCRCMLHGW